VRISKKKNEDDRTDFLKVMLQATKEGVIKWNQVKGESNWETKKKNNHIIFHPADNGCVSMGYSINGRSGMFNIWPGDKKAVIVGKELNELITGVYKKELAAELAKSATLGEIAAMFLK
jgi:hypothetical protein